MKSIESIRNFGNKYAAFVDELLVPVLENMDVERWVIKEFKESMVFDRDRLKLNIYDEENKEYNHYEIPFKKIITKPEKKLRVLSFRKNKVEHKKKRYIFVQYLPTFVTGDRLTIKFDTEKELIENKYFVSYKKVFDNVTLINKKKRETLYLL